MLFGETAPKYEPPAEDDEPFSLTDDAPMRKAMVKVRARHQVFRFQVLARYGAKVRLLDYASEFSQGRPHQREAREGVR